MNSSVCMFYTNIVHNLLFYEREGDTSLLT